MVYARLLVKDTDHNVMEALGTMSILKLDGRKKLANLGVDAVFFELRMKEFYPDIIGHVIFETDNLREPGKVLYEYIRSGVQFKRDGVWQ